MTFPSGKAYIGITTRTLIARFEQHVKDARLGRGHAVHAALRKYCAEVVKVEPLVFADDLGYLQELEQAAIKAFGTKAPGGYNMTAGGDGFTELDREAVLARTATLMGDPERLERWRRKLSEAWTADKRKARAQAIRQLWATDYGAKLREKHKSRPRRPPPRKLTREEHAERRRAWWTADKRQVQALRIALAGSERSAEIASKQREVMTSVDARARIARALSSHADATFVKGRKPLRGGFTRHVWDQIPEPATFEELFALGFSKGRLGKALKNGNLVRVDGSSPRAG